MVGAGPRGRASYNERSSVEGCKTRAWSSSRRVTNQPPRLSRNGGTVIAEHSAIEDKVLLLVDSVTRFREGSP